MESALMTPPPEAQARRSAKADLPLAVGPAMRIAETRVTEYVALVQEHEAKKSATFWIDHA
jgi:hypothetical protein